MECFLLTFCLFPGESTVERGFSIMTVVHQLEFFDDIINPPRPMNFGNMY